MSHKTLIDGTVYEISGGKTLIGGTAYEITNGKTLVDGTVYEVGFDDGMCMVTVTGSLTEYYGSITIDGTSYYPTTTIEVPIGYEIYCSVTSDDFIYLPSRIIVNGVTMADTLETRQTAYYVHTLTRNTTIDIRDSYDYNSMASGYKCTITITDESQ